MTTLTRVVFGSAPIIIVLVAAAFVLPPDFPYLIRQLALCGVGVIGIAAAERLLFGPGASRIATALGFVIPRWRAIVVAFVVSLPMWAYLPIYGWVTGTPLAMHADWLTILLGVVLVNGLAEEVIHRAFIFGHLRKERSFAVSASISAAIFGLQHVYLVFSIGPIAGGASVVLALLLAFPLAFLYERGGNSLAGPMLLHTSSNAPIMLFAPAETTPAVMLPYMAVVLGSMYLSFAFFSFLDRPMAAATPKPSR